ncbi:MAG TPA: DUF222 domain-containing protein, partial [Leifsonia sp.]|nr:DUF222 domain-containing protein [Leifsonia sp.]
MTTSPGPAAAVAALQDALAPFALPGVLAHDELLAAVSVLGEVQRVLDVIKIRVAGELVRRSGGPGPENPVSHTGHGNPAVLLAVRWRIPVGAARQYCLVGDATSPTRSPTGEVVPARHPFLADRLGAVGVEQAGVIVRELGKAAPGCSGEDLASGERLLVEHAADLTVTELRVLAGQVRDRLDEDGIVSREVRQRARRSLTITTTSDGLTHLDWFLDPESAGYVVTAIDAVVGQQLRAVRFPATADPAGDESGDSEEMPESRSLAQLRSDAATDVFRHLATCTQQPVDGKPPVTMIVRIPLESLQTGVGTGQIDGVRAPVSAGTARRLAADADLIPVVLGGGSEVLDFGRTRRLFSRAQKLALAERDGGCAWTGCPHPPSYTEAHHIRWWTAHYGTTDLNNGILLCSTHHHRIHNDGWQIQVRDQVPWFIPPGHVDPHRRPRRGGR